MINTFPEEAITPLVSKAFIPNVNHIAQWKIKLVSPIIVTTKKEFT